MRSPWPMLAALAALSGCPEPPPEVPPGVDDSEGGEDDRGGASEVGFPEGPLRAWAVRDARLARRAVDRPVLPLAWMARFDVLPQGAGDGRWIRVGWVLHRGGLRLFELDARSVRDPAHGRAFVDHPSGAALTDVWTTLVAGRLPPLSAADCASLGGDAACAPLLDRVRHAEARPTGPASRVAEASRAVLARDGAGRLLLVDLAAESPRVTEIPPGSE